MAKQKSNIEQPTFPESIRKHFESFVETVTAAHYGGILAIDDGNKIVHVPTFVVNEKYYVYVHNAQNGTFQYETIFDREKRKRKYGKNVRKLMKKYGFSWELSKVIFNVFPNDTTDRHNLCHDIQDARSDISCDFGDWKKQFEYCPKDAMANVLDWYNFSYWLNTKNPHVYEALKDYLFGID